MRYKMLLFMLLLCIEGIFLLYWSVTGSHGIRTVRKLRNEIALLEKNNTLLEARIQELEKLLVDWDTDVAYKEQYARRYLHMAGKDEIWFRY